MRTIWKQQLAIVDLQTLTMPKGAKLLSVGNQKGNLCLWYSVDTDMPNEDRVIEIVGTGNSVEPRSRDFIGTAVIDPFVWHVFERR